MAFKRRIKLRYILGGVAATLAFSQWVIGCSQLPPVGFADKNGHHSVLARGANEGGGGVGGGGTVAATGGGGGGRAGGRAGGAGGGVAGEGGTGGGAIGTPMAGLSPVQLADFQAGDRLFSLTWKFGPRADGTGGLGPLFNQNKCIACHSGGGAGGPDGGPLVVRMAVINDPGHPVTPADLVAANGFNNLASNEPTDPFAIGGPLMQLNVAGPFQRETLPTQAQLDNIQTVTGQAVTVITSQRQGTIVGGSGLLCAIPLQSILDEADVQANDDFARAMGIGGVPNNVGNNVGRLGWKAHSPDNVDFVADAARQEVGLSSSHNPWENRPNGPAVHVGGPGEPPADLTDQQFDQIVAFCNRVSPPAAINQGLPEVIAGKAAFAKAGCAVCHYSGYVTGDVLSAPDAVINEPELFNKPVPCYSDLLLHHMGEGLADGFVMGEAGGDQWKTPQLWGLRFKGTYLHDKRAKTLDEAIRMHASNGSEANLVINNYLGTGSDPDHNLDNTERANLQAFLGTL